MDRVVHEVVRQVIGRMVTDLIDTTRAVLDSLRPQFAADIRHANEAVVRISPAMQDNIKPLREFLTTRMYRHSRVNRACVKAERIVKDIFACLMDKPGCLPEDWQATLQGCEGNATFKARVVADYIAGMTDRFAIQEHRRLFSTETLV